MKMLILGSKGMLGQALCRGTYTESASWRRTDAELIGWDRDEIDITDKKQVEEKISRLSPNVIINCAAYNDVDGAEKEGWEWAMKVNGEAVGYLAETAVRLGAILVHYSSDYVFRGDCQMDYQEDDEPDPQSWYGKSKLLGEQRILNLKSKILNFKYYLIRTSRLFGPTGAGKGAKESFVDLMLRLGKERGKVEVIDEEISSPTYVPDLAKATFELLASGKPWGIYHRTNDGACTWYEWARKIFELTGARAKLNPVPVSRFSRPAPRPRYSVLLTTKLPPLRKWEEALEEYLSRFIFTKMLLIILLASTRLMTFQF